MLIRCWGARGSIPVSGREFLKYGGDTTCIEVRSSAGEVVIIDAGSGIRRLGSRLLDENIRSYRLFFTHAHWDHILGFPFFRPIYVDGTSLDFYGCPFAQESLKSIIAKTMTVPNFPVNFEDISITLNYHGSCDEGFSIGGMKIDSININHPNRGKGYRFTENGRTFVFITDNELAYRHEGGLEFDDYARFCRGADILMHDSEYTDRDYAFTKSWGHSHFRDALELALAAGVRKFGLIHHNQERTDLQIDEMVEECRRIAEARGSSLECFAVRQDMEFIL